MDACREAASKQGATGSQRAGTARLARQDMPTTLTRMTTRNMIRTMIRTISPALVTTAVVVVCTLMLSDQQIVTCKHPRQCHDWKPCQPLIDLDSRHSCKARGIGHAAVQQVLVVHEQHPQPLGCDRRLLSLIGLLQAERRQVSLLYRKHVAEREQSPRTAALAELLGIADFALADLEGGCLRAPPALYRFTGRMRQLARIAQTGWFDLVLIGVWFWNDPAPAFAELTLPLLRAHAPSHRQPYVGLIVDDAHAVRAERLARWETDPVVQRTYEQQAASLVPRLRALYSLADAVLHVSAADQYEERRAFASLDRVRWLLLRTPLRQMRASSGEAESGGAPASSATRSAQLQLQPKAPSAATRPVPVATRYVGFLGNGQTATNHQGVQWFLSHCWPRLRAAEPTLRLRLVGRSPGATSNGSGVFDCDRTPARVSGGRRCGWAWGTRYAGREAEHGIDELGFLASPQMVAELRTWRAMIAPIRATTGINTKLLVALELGVPLVVTRAAASPLALGAVSEAPPAAQLADEPDEFTAAILRLFSSAAAWVAASQAALAAYASMEKADPAAGDMAALLKASCSRGAYVAQRGEPSSQREVLRLGRLEECSILDVSAVCSGRK